MNNPYQEFEKKQDERYEKLIRQKIQNIIELVGNESDDTARISLLQKIVDLYEDLRIQVLNYSSIDESEKNEYLRQIDELLEKKYKALKKRKSDEEKSKKELKDRIAKKEAMYKKLYEKALQDDEFASWEDYKNSERD